MACYRLVPFLVLGAGCVDACVDARDGAPEQGPVEEQASGEVKGAGGAAEAEAPVAAVPAAPGQPITHGGVIQMVDADNHIEAVATETGVTFYFSDASLQPHPMPCNSTNLTRTSWGCAAVWSGQARLPVSLGITSFVASTPLKAGETVKVGVMMQMDPHFKTGSADFELVVGREVSDEPLRHGGVVLPVGNGSFVEHLAGADGHHFWFTDPHGHPVSGQSSYWESFTFDDGKVQEDASTLSGHVVIPRPRAGSRDITLTFESGLPAIHFPATSRKR